MRFLSLFFVVGVVMIIKACYLWWRGSDDAGCAAGVGAVGVIEPVVVKLIECPQRPCLVN